MSKKVDVNLSTPFLFRARCASCGSLPSVYFRTANNYITDNVYQNIKATYFISNSTINSRTMLKEFCLLKGYKPRFDRTIEVKRNIVDISDCLLCKCGHSSWFFCGNSNNAKYTRLEVTSKRCRNKFTYSY